MSLSSFIWPVADLPRSDYKQSKSGEVLMPFTAEGPKQNLRNPPLQASF
jgi:hypothetical protein